MLTLKITWQSRFSIHDVIYLSFSTQFSQVKQSIKTLLDVQNKEIKFSEFSVSSSSCLLQIKQMQILCGKDSLLKNILVLVSSPILVTHLKYCSSEMFSTWSTCFFCNVLSKKHYKKNQLCQNRRLLCIRKKNN